MLGYKDKESVYRTSLLSISRFEVRLVVTLVDGCVYTEDISFNLTHSYMLTLSSHWLPFPIFRQHHKVHIYTTEFVPSSELGLACG